MAGDSVGKGLPGKMCWREQVQPEVRDPRELPGGRAVLGLTVSLQKSGGRAAGWRVAGEGADHQRSTAWEPGEVC